MKNKKKIQDSEEQQLQLPTRAEARNTKKRRKKMGALSTVILLLIFLVGLSVMLYPTVSNWWNSRVQSRAIAKYDDFVASLSDQDYDEYFEAADDYNKRLFETPSAFMTPEVVEGYQETLDVTGTGIMGYITIEKIDVSLPIYHSTDESVLQIAAGHLEGTSLPVGGENTHCTISAHRGLPSAKLFTDLDQLEEGDTFYITVLNRTLTYEIDQIHIVEPSELDDLRITPGGDYCTLMTCTPYGINSHRMLIRGKRIETPADALRRPVVADAKRIETVVVLPFVVIPLLIIIMIIVIVHSHHKKKRR